MKKLLALIGGAAVLLLWAAAPASAHVYADVTEAPAGSFALFNIVVPHGCEGEGGDTVKLEVQMPESIESATPEAVPGWEATIDDSGPVTLTWEGGPLAHDQLLEFAISVQMPDTPGETALFPAIQTCESGDEVAWIEETPEGGEEPEHPAPAIAITEATEDHHGGTEEEADEHADEEAEHAEAAATGAESEDEGPDALAIVAFIVGTLGLVAGGAALISTRRAG